MKKLTHLLLGTALVAFVATPAFAADTTTGKKTKEITEVVGYEVTEKIPENNPKSEVFMKMDRDGDGEISLKEYQNRSAVENAYEMFITMDTDKSKTVSYEEFASFNPTKGNTQVESELHGKVAVKGTNIKSRRYTEKSYFVPVEPKVVKEEAIEPASGEY